MSSHVAHALFGDARDCAAPSGMKRADRSPLGIGNEYWHAVGDFDGKQHAGGAGDQAIADEGSGIRAIDAMHDGRVDLLDLQ